MACENNDTDAMNSLAIIYFMTESVENQREGIQLLKKAIALGDSFACGNLGLAYRKGVGVEQNPEESEKWHMNAENQRKTDAVFQEIV